MKFNYEAALITGASRGLGKAIAFALADRGVRLALVARGGEELEETAAEIRRRHGKSYPVTTIQADIADKNAIYAVAHRAQVAIGPIDLLIQNASSLGPTPLRLLLDTDC